MKFDLLIFVITGFFIANTYYDGKYIEILKSWQKYYKMAGIAFVGLSTYAFMKKHPSQFNSLASNAHELIQTLPIDKESSDIITPILNGFSTKNTEYVAPQQKRMMNSGTSSTKRCVSETKKKFVAAQQGWKCNKCNQQLSAWFEVDHTVRLDNGGTNHVNNLVALCRNCHGEKTAMENL